RRPDRAGGGDGQRRALESDRTRRRAGGGRRHGRRTGQSRHGHDPQTPGADRGPLPGRRRHRAPNPVTYRAAIALGSNLGDRHSTLSQARARLEEIGDVVALSALYETAPVGGPDQDSYLNAVAVMTTDLEPADLLARLQGIETDAGRVRRER